MYDRLRYIIFKFMIVLKLSKMPRSARDILRPKDFQYLRLPPIDVGHTDPGPARYLLAANERLSAVRAEKMTTGRKQDEERVFCYPYQSRWYIVPAVTTVRGRKTAEDMVGAAGIEPATPTV